MINQIFFSIFVILICHFVFDFFLQTRKMAENKSTILEYLFQHAIVYGIGLAVAVVLMRIYFPTNPGTLAAWWMVNSVMHFVTDYVTSKATTALHKTEDRKGFFDMVGLDQLIHMITLFGTLYWILK